MSRSRKRGYRQKKITTKGIISIGIISYIIILIIGIAFTIAVPFLGHRSALIQLAKDRGEHTLLTYSQTYDITYATEYYLYNESGVKIVSERSFLSSKGVLKVREMLPELLSKETMYKIQRLPIGGMEGSDREVFCIIAGNVVRRGSGNRFGSIVIRELSDIDTTLVTFIGIYSIIFIAGMVMLIMVFRQHRQVVTLQRDLVSNVGHELKTPITSIKAMGALLYDGMYKTKEDEKRYAHTILEESDKLRDLVMEIMDLSKLQSDNAVFNINDFYADGVFQPVIDNYIMLCGDMGINMDISALDLESIPELRSDFNQLIKVWRIILDNAVKFAGKGGNITVNQKLSVGKVTFSVSDDGLGISKKDISRVFERFYMADRTHNSEGSGLGLAIAHEIMESLGEKIWVESKEGEGSTFFFTVSYR